MKRSLQFLSHPSSPAAGGRRFSDDTSWENAALLGLLTEMKGAVEPSVCDVRRRVHRMGNLYSALRVGLIVTEAMTEAIGALGRISL